MVRRIKTFISYSHHDADIRKRFESFLTQLRREKVIETWTDRELIPGQDIDPEISRNLEESDVVILLVSQDFIASTYCYENELLGTLKRQENGECVVFPILCRTCDWKNTPLSGKYIYSDALPFSKADDKDEFLLGAASELRKMCSGIQIDRAGSSDLGAVGSIRELISSDLVERLNDTKIKFSNGYIDRIPLEDLYVWPDLRPVSVALEDSSLVLTAQSLLDEQRHGPHCALIGEEQSGKTSLLQMLALSLIDSGCRVDFVRGESITSSKDFEKIERSSDSSYLAGFPNIKRVLLVDDFEKSPLNNRAKSDFIGAAFDRYDRVFLAASSEIGVLGDVFRKFDNHMVAEICALSRKRRATLIHNWYSAGRKDFITEQELEKSFDAADAHVEMIVNRRILPPKPIYVLMAIQTLDMSSSQGSDMSSYGHCYHKMIVQSLERARVKASMVDTYINLLTNISYHLYSSKLADLSEDECQMFLQEYAKRYLDPGDDAIGVLIRSGLLRVQAGRLRVSYKYVYYYCIGKYIAEDYSVRRREIDSLADALHLEQNAHILSFITHHTKSQEVIDDIALKVMGIFQSSDEAEFNDEDFENLSEISKEIPALVMEERSAREERERLIASQDAEEEQDRIEVGATSASEDDEVSRFLRSANQAYRAVEVLGQIVRNRKGSFTKDQLALLADQGIGVGLRFLKAYFQLTKTLKDEILDDIAKEFDESADDLGEIEKRARRFFWGLCYLMSFSVIHKMSLLLGEDALIPVFKHLAEIKRKEGRYSHARRLCDLAIKMHHSKVIPKAEISALAHELSGIPIAKRLLQEMAVRHVYLNTVDFKDKQWIAAELDIPVKSQNFISLKASR